MEMKEPGIIPESGERDPKISITGSFVHPRMEIASIALLFLAFPGEEKIEPTYLNSENKLVFTAEVISRVKRVLIENGVEGGRRSKAIERFSESMIATRQLETLVLAFEIFLPLAAFSFEDEKLTSSAERTGGKRFPKIVTFTSGLSILTSGFQFDPQRYIALLVSWLLGEPTQNELLSLEKRVRQDLFRLGSRTQFRIRSTESRSHDSYFNLLGLYDTLLINKTFSLAGLENKGPMRALRSSIKDNVFPGLIISRDIVSLEYSDHDQDQFSYVELKFLYELEKAYRDVRNVKQVVVGKGIDSKSLSGAERNIIYYGVPGSGKSFAINQSISDADISERVVFHPDFLYSNFIGQIMPTVEKGIVTYEFRPGVFARILKSAVENPKRKHNLIIEELNRGNASAIFGDIFQLLDRNADGFSEYSIQNPEIASYVFGDSDRPVRLPGNLYLLATMNTSDQNVFTLDNAFQRRWSMKMTPNDIKNVPFAHLNILDTSVTWGNFVRFINANILKANSGLSSLEDKRLGVFFVSADDISQENVSAGVRAFSSKVLKYLWDDAFKFSRSDLFSTSYINSLEECIHSFCSETGDNRWRAIFNDRVVTELIKPEDDSASVSEPEFDG